MKILFVHSLSDTNIGGGAEVMVWEQMRGLRDAGHECVLLATSDKAGLEKTDQEGITIWKAGIRNVYWPYHKKRPVAPLRILWHALDSYNPWMQKYIREVVKIEKPDVASVHNLPGWSAASWRTLSQLGVPSVQVLHDYYPLCAKVTMYKNGRNCSGQCAGCRALRLPHRTLSRYVHAVVGVSRFILDRHLSLGYFEGVPIQRVIHNVRDAQTLGLDAIKKNKAHTGLRFGYIGRLDSTKGVDTLINAFSNADLPDAELWVAGSGRQDYEDHLFSKASNDRIRFLGRVAPGEFYPQVDVIVVPSLWNDNLPTVVIEALAFGKPVIGSRRGGIPEMIRDGENGLLFEPKSPSDLKLALETLCDDELRSKLKHGCFYSVRPFLDMATWMSSYETLYRNVVFNANRKVS